MKLPRSFYECEDVVALAIKLLGKELVTCFEGVTTSGIITETEAYAGITDKASHAYGDRRTARTEIMYARGGTAYVYLCYGMHSLFNVVTNAKNVPHAILIRAIQPLKGVDVMLARTGKSKVSSAFADGPGKVAKALGIHYSHSGLDLTKGEIWIEDRNMVIPPEEIIAGPRIGVGYAGDDALLPYRFIWKTKNINIDK